MGVEIHDMVIVRVDDYVLMPEVNRDNEFHFPVLADFIAEMPEELRPCVQGPFRSPVNGGMTFLWLPDGSKEGFRLSDLADEWREKFIRLWSWSYSDGSSPYEVIHLRFGPDLRGNDVRPQVIEPFACYCEDRSAQQGHERDCPQYHPDPERALEGGEPDPTEGVPGICQYACTHSTGDHGPWGCRREECPCRAPYPLP